ncbi:MAG: translation initiation factor IF-3 [Verrucomicrobia bacterium]|nr:translation initiation factor IF-3 [Verrucomicrobiota bacterium]
MRVNHDIRAPKLRVISATGEQLGVLSFHEALSLAQQQGLDLVEVVAKEVPPVCKIIDYGKFRYDQTKREKESKKSQHQVKVKELKVSPNISEHDLDVKLRHAREFLEAGNKVKISCLFRGREMMHPEFGERLFDKIKQVLEDLAIIEVPAKMFGRMLSMILAPGAKKKGKV